MLNSIYSINTISTITMWGCTKNQPLFMLVIVLGLLLLLYLPHGILQAWTTHSMGSNEDLIVEEAADSVFNLQLQTTHSRSCKPHTNIYYVKLHKVGSTTICNIMSRFGLAHNLMFAAFRCAFNSITYPNPPDIKYLVGKKYTPVGHGGERPYNIINSHTQYGREEALKYMPGDTKVITILREPFSHLLSCFAYFHLNIFFNMSCKTEDSVTEFLSRPEYYDTLWDSYGCKPHTPLSWTQNNQAHHFGWMPQNKTDGVAEFLHKLDHELTMVGCNCSIYSRKHGECQIWTRSGELCGVAYEY